MNVDFDVIIVGSGPAGVSVAFPLVEKGIRVLMVDGGHLPTDLPLQKPYLESRVKDKAQWQWMLGRNFHALKMQEAISPKLRVPHLEYAFQSFETSNHLEKTDFIALGSMATGGLSNAWGAGVARFSRDDLAKFPLSPNALDTHYENVSRRIGISGKSHDDLTDYFGVDQDARHPVDMDEVNSDFFRRYSLLSKKIAGFKMGRSRVAVLSNTFGERLACNNQGNCLWGCSRGAIYSAQYDVERLKKFSNFSLIPGAVVDEILVQGDSRKIAVTHKKNQLKELISANKIVLAAGTLATTRLALELLKTSQSVPILSSPTAAFIVWNYRKFGLERVPSFGLGQLSYTVDFGDSLKAFGSIFSTNGIPLAEFVKHVPLARPLGIDVLSAMLSSCAIGNLFLPGSLSQASAKLNGRYLKIEGGYAETVAPFMKEIAKKIRSNFFAIGGLVLPGSFTVGRPGSDIHYAGTLPMSFTPSITQTSPQGELYGVKGIYIADGACLPYLPEKSHTLTIMANAARIGYELANIS